MEALAHSQNELGKIIEKNYQNFLKDSSERKTPQYSTQRLAVLKSNWELFQYNDSILQKFVKENAEHAYFTNKFFEKIKAIADRHREGLKLLQSPSGGSQEATAESDQADATTKRLNTIAKTIRQLLSKVEETGRSFHYYQYQVEALLRQKYGLDEINNQLWAQLEDYEESPQQQLYEAVDQEVQDTIIRLRELMVTDTKNDQFKAEGAAQAVKLPKITLPTFNGKYLQWIQFKELFIQLVHSQDLSDTQKMFHLVTSLRDEPSTLIQHLSVCSRNYQPAWDLLCQRYNNKRLLVSGYLNKLVQQSATQMESAQSIKRLHDTTKECLMGLKNLGVAVEHWDAIVVHLLLKKLDKTTHALYEQSLSDPKALDLLDNLLTFLETRFQSLEALNTKPSIFEEKSTKSRAAALVATGAAQCVVCNQSHPLFSCRAFRECSVNKRIDTIQKNKLCFNCMKPGHSAKTCDKGSCTKCSKKHNTLLHRDIGSKTNTTGTQGSSQSTDSAPKVSLLGRHDTKQSYVLLGTVRCSIKAADGQQVQCRALLDSGSQINGISERVARRLHLRTTNDPTTIAGIGNKGSVAQKRAYIQITSPVTQCDLQVEAFILPQITSDQPSRFIDIASWDLPGHVRLADPTFNVPGPIDVLIGAEHYFNLVKVGRIELGDERPALQNTTFGWIVSGKTMCSGPASCLLATMENDDLNHQVRRFWEIETLVTTTPAYSRLEKDCENFYKETTKRSRDGRFIVRLPFTKSATALGESRKLALTRLYAMERKLERNQELKKEYHAFMKEYLALGHMTEIKTIPESGYYLPHHCVIKPDSDTTKVRVVFDASAKTTTNVALNEILYTGPKIQEDIFSVLLRFRVPRFVCSADIMKMYRQIIMHEDDRKYQLVLWRESSSTPVRTYRLNTVTYGFTSAPFHAIRSLQELATEASVSSPRGANAIRKNMYVDDAMFGADSLDEALNTQKELIDILQSGGFSLRKWCANHPAFTKNLPADQVAQQLELTSESQQEVKTLGLIWRPSSDEFRIRVNFKELEQVTKRQILSDIAHLFDPLGLIGPVTVTAKIILQKLWSRELNWDDAVPEDLESEWIQFRTSLLQLGNLKIQRHVCAHKTPTSRQLHVFCDASEKAYGAAVYVRSQLKDGTTIVRLLCAKSRIAPLKPISIPRLELCAAKMGSELVLRVQKDLEWQDPIFLWSDSTIVLAWLNSPVSSLHKFVANRVSSIQDMTSGCLWKYVPSRENPADFISRGISPDKLAGCHTWFFGPIFLHAREEVWPKLKQLPETSIERKTSVTSLPILRKEEQFIQKLSHLSSITRIQRTIAYILRFVFNANQYKGYMKIGDLTVRELYEAMELIIKEVQQDAFAQDIQDLQNHRAVNPKGKLVGLDPFIDDRGVLRVGGRLENASLPFEAKHPALLPDHHFITKLLFRHTHWENNHAGRDALLAIFRQRYWPINGSKVARATVHGCVVCSRYKPKFFEQIMGNLPSDRVQPARPFLKSGVDFCGPFYVRQEIRGRGPLKIYWAIFCCFTTKAVHIEVVKNLTTEAFIKALKRFTGRRGNCEKIYCDNATNFVGANNQLKELEEAIHAGEAKQHIKQFAAKRNIEFKFIPPRAPHFGGLWEAAVKSAKGILKKAVGIKPLTYEEMSTIAVEIEAMMNSRPLTPLSNDPNDLTALTPGHFLIGGPVNATIDPAAEVLCKPLPETYKDLASIKQEFWSRWQVEYLSQLQERRKWKTSHSNVVPDTMVLIKEANTPIASWPLGRIMRTMPGKDGKVRAAEIRTGDKTITRVIHQLAPLPMDTGHNTSEATTQSGHKSPDTSAASTSQPIADPHEPSQKKRRIATSLLTALIVLCCISPARAVKQVQITPIMHNPGLYFENLGSASLIKDEWTLIAFYNMTTFWREYELITKGVDNLQMLCNVVIQQAHCKETVEHFNITITQIAAKNELLRPHRRAKRAPLDIIGNVANSLFGILDSNYAEEMTRTIKELNSNEQHLLKLIRNQTSLIDSTQNIIAKSSETTHRQLTKVYQALNHTAEALNSINQELDSLKVTEGFNSLSVRLILTMSDFQRMQDLLIDVLVDKQHGKINPLLLSAQQLHVQTQLIKDQLPRHLTLPHQGEELAELYQMMTVEGKVATEAAIFRIRIPLLSTNTWIIMSVTPVPIFRDHKVLRIDSSNSIMLVNIQEEQFYPIATPEFSSRCPKYPHIGYLCHLEQPSISNINEDSCELQLLLHKSNISACHMQEVSNDPRWRHLAHSNKWLLATPEEIVITTICDGHITHSSIKGTNIIEIPIGCAIKDGTRTYKAQLFTNQVIATIIPMRNLSEIQFNSSHDTIEGISVVQANLSSEMTILRSRINDFKDATIQIPSISSHDVHQYSVSYSCLVIIILLTIWWIVWKLSKHGERHPPVPRPRTSTNQPEDDFSVQTTF